jgi:hypothetical protein
MTTSDIVLPEVTEEITHKYGGMTAVVVNGKFVAFGKGSLGAEKAAKRQGFNREDVCFVYIFKPDVVYC